MSTIVKDYGRIDAGLVAGFRKIGTATAHEAQGRTGAIAFAIKPIYPGMTVCGPALTVRCQVGDNLTLHAALHIAKPGDVLVATIGDYAEQGIFGDVMASVAQARQSRDS